MEGQIEPQNFRINLNEFLLKMASLGKWLEKSYISSYETGESVRWYCDDRVHKYYKRYLNYLENPVPTCKRGRNVIKYNWATVNKQVTKRTRLVTSPLKGESVKGKPFASKAKTLGSSPSSPAKFRNQPDNALFQKSNIAKTGIFWK